MAGRSRLEIISFFGFKLILFGSHSKFLYPSCFRLLFDYIGRHKNLRQNPGNEKRKTIYKKSKPI